MRHLTIRFGSTLVVVGLVIGGIQVALRAINGNWPQWRLALIWDAIGGNRLHWSSYPAAEHAAAWVLAWPLSLSIMAAGLLAWTVGIWIWTAFARG